MPRVLSGVNQVHHVENSDTASVGLLTDSETARLVALCAEQIKAAVDEAFRDIDDLSRAVLDSARHASALLGAVSDKNPGVSPAQDSIQSDSQALQQAVQTANVRLQFADRLNQRLSNVSRNLASLAELMRSTELPITDIMWSGFLEQTRATFTMEQERRMFDAMFPTSAAEAGAAPATDASQDPTVFGGGVGSDG